MMQGVVVRKQPSKPRKPRKYETSLTSNRRRDTVRFDDTESLLDSEFSSESKYVNLFKPIETLNM